MSEQSEELGTLYWDFILEANRLLAASERFLAALDESLNINPELIRCLEHLADLEIAMENYLVQNGIVQGPLLQRPPGSTRRSQSPSSPQNQALVSQLLMESHEVSNIETLTISDQSDSSPSEPDAP